MATKDEILGRQGGGDLPNLRDYAGQVITITEAYPEKKKNFDGVSFQAITEDGEIVDFWTSAAAIVQKLTELVEADDGDAFPAEVKVVMGASSYGKGKEWLDILPPHLADA